MNTQSKARGEQITGEDLVDLSLEELEALFLQLYAALEKTFYTMRGYAREPTQVGASSLGRMGLEEHWQTRWEMLKATVDAILYHAVFWEQDQQEWEKLSRRLRKYMACMQAVTSGDDVTSEWLAKREALVAEIASLLKEGVCG